MTNFEIIDFHMHPFLNTEDNLCFYKDLMSMTPETVPEEMKNASINRFCGSVIKKKEAEFESFRKANREALKLREMYRGMYVPGFQITPNFIEESIEEIDYAYQCGVKLIGELVPYIHNWEDYSCREFDCLLNHIEKYDMVVSVHTINFEQMEKMVENHPNIRFVFAHPGEKENIEKHIEVMKKFDNVFLDISGTGILRYGMLKKLVREAGAERILFGTDYPICNVSAYVSGVLNEKITDREKELIFSGNAKKLLQLIND